MIRRPKTLVATLLAAALASGMGAQEPPAAIPEEPFEERLEVIEVLLDVVVTDRKGRIVAGLGTEDFRVREEGEPVELTSVEFVPHEAVFETAPGADPLAGMPDPRRALADRFFILFFQDDRLGNSVITGQMLDLTRWIERWIEEDLGYNDWVAVVGYQASLRLWTDFTRDRQRILDAVRAVTQGDRAFGGRPSRDRRRPGDPSLAALMPPPGGERDRRTRNVQKALRLIGEASRGVVGRKNLLLFSIGFGRPPEPGFPNWSPHPTYYPAMREALNDHHVAVYAIDLLSTVEQGSIQDRGLNQSLSQLADDTGGEYYFRFTDFLQPLRDVEEATTGYYMLSYAARVPADASGFRRVEVEVDVPKLRVRTRRGYRFGESPALEEDSAEEGDG